MSDILSPERVRSVIADCLFKEGEDTTNHVRVEGVAQTFGFHPARLESHRDDIIEMLGELPDNFKSSHGSGWTFLNACQDRHGELWTGEQQMVDQLLILGIGVGLADFCLPRQHWHKFPGGMPYFMVKL